MDKDIIDKVKAKVSLMQGKKLYHPEWVRDKHFIPRYINPNGNIIGECINIHGHYEGRIITSDCYYQFLEAAPYDLDKELDNL